MRDSAPLVNTTSFSTMRVSTRSPRAMRRRPRASARSSIGRACRRATALERRRTARRCVISVRKPRLPKFTPRIGMSRPGCAMRSAMPSSVPSPPSTTTRSTLVGQLVARRRVGAPRRSPASARGRRFRRPPRCRARAATRRAARGAREAATQAVLGDDADASDGMRTSWAQVEQELDVALLRR